MTTSETPLLDTVLIPRWMEKSASSPPPRSRSSDPNTPRLFHASDVMAVVPVHIMAMSHFFTYTALVWTGIVVSSHASPISKYIGGIYGLVWNVVIMHTGFLLLDVVCTLATFLVPRLVKMPYRVTLALAASVYAMYLGFQIGISLVSLDSSLSTWHNAHSITVFIKELSLSWTRALYSSDAYLVGSIQSSLQCCGFASPLDRPYLTLTSNHAINTARASACSVLPGCQAAIQSDVLNILFTMQWIMISLRCLQCLIWMVYVIKYWNNKETDGWLYISFIRNTALLSQYQDQNDTMTSLWSYSKTVSVYSSVCCPRVMAEFEEWSLEECDRIDPLPTYSPASPPCYHHIIPPPAYTD